MSRTAKVALGRLQLDAGLYDDAICSAKKILASHSICMSAQTILYRAYQAKVSNGDSVPQGEIVGISDLKDRFCSKPFEYLVTGYGGESFRGCLKSVLMEYWQD
jgi:hypothetical protein